MANRFYYSFIGRPSMNYYVEDTDFLDAEIRDVVPDIEVCIEIGDQVIYYNDLGIPKVIVSKSEGIAQRLMPQLRADEKKEGVRHEKNGLYGLTKAKKRL